MAEPATIGRPGRSWRAWRTARTVEVRRGGAAPASSAPAALARSKAGARSLTVGGDASPSGARGGLEVGEGLGELLAARTGRKRCSGRSPPAVWRRASRRRNAHGPPSQCHRSGRSGRTCRLPISPWSAVPEMREQQHAALLGERQQRQHLVYRNRSDDGGRQHRAQGRADQRASPWRWCRAPRAFSDAPAVSPGSALAGLGFGTAEPVSGTCTGGAVGLAAWVGRELLQSSPPRRGCPKGQRGTPVLQTRGFGRGRPVPLHGPPGRLPCGGLTQDGITFSAPDRYCACAAGPWRHRSGRSCRWGRRSPDRVRCARVGEAQ